MKNSVRNKIDINFEIFNQVINKCSLRDEIRKKFLGLNIEKTPTEEGEFRVPVEDMFLHKITPISCFSQI